MKNIEFTKEWLYKNDIAIECENAEHAEKICEIFCVSGKYSITNKYVSTGLSSENRVTVHLYNYVNGTETVILSSEVIAQYEAQNPKIIGYRCPFDMYQQGNDWLVNKGDLYIIAHEGSNCYAPKKWIECDLPKDIKTLYIPFEIIDKLFEPVYEEVKPCFSEYDDIFKYFKGNKIIFEEGKPITIYDTNVLVGTGRTHFVLSKQDYDFTPEFEQKLKEMWINI